MKDITITQQESNVGWSFIASLEIKDGCKQGITINEYLVGLGVLFEPNCAYTARQVSRMLHDPIEVWHIGARSFARFEIQKLPDGCEATKSRAIFDVVAKPNNLRWFSDKTHYDFNFSNIKPEFISTE